MAGGKVMEGRKKPISEPFRWQTIRGEPRTIAGHRLTPVARLVSFSRGRGTLGQNSLSGWALGFVRVIPLGVVVEADDQEEWVAVQNATASALRGMMLAAAAITLLLAVVRRVAPRRPQPAPDLE
jgi:hypothetical protein